MASSVDKVKDPRPDPVQHGACEAVAAFLQAGGLVWLFQTPELSSLRVHFRAKQPERDLVERDAFQSTSKPNLFGTDAAVAPPRDRQESRI